MFSAYVRLIVSDTTVEFTAQTSFFRLLDASVWVRATTGTGASLSGASIQFEARLQTSSVRSSVNERARAFRERAIGKINKVGYRIVMIAGFRKSWLCGDFWSNKMHHDAYGCFR